MGKCGVDCVWGDGGDVGCVWGGVFGCLCGEGEGGEGLRCALPIGEMGGGLQGGIVNWTFSVVILDGLYLFRRVPSLGYRSFVSHCTRIAFCIHYLRLIHDI